MKLIQKFTLLSSVLLITSFSIVNAKPKKKTIKIKKDDGQSQLLKDFINRKSYLRDGIDSTPSPFRNLVRAEQIRIKIKKDFDEKVKKDLEDQARTDALTGNTSPIKKSATNDPKKPVDLLVLRDEAIQKVKKDMKVVDKHMNARNYRLAEQLLNRFSIELAKHKDTEDARKTVLKRKEEVVQEHADWDIIQKAINNLNVDAMFMAKGKRKIALINNNAVEEGDKLNDLLNLNKVSPIKLNFVSTNSITIQYKKFTLKKDLIDNE